MKKIIEKMFCDDCGKEISSNKPVTTINVIQSTGEFGSIGLLKDFCWECLEWRVNHSMNIIKDKTCQYDYKKCRKCGGSGLIHVSKSDTEFGFTDCIAKCPDCNKEKNNEF